jgi:homoserine kinase type II
LSVYTAVDREELTAWLAPLGLGPLGEVVGIAAGIQNSNYFVTAGGRRRVLTLFESLGPGQLDFYLALQLHLAGRGIPCPRPEPDPGGALWRPLAGKPAALLSCLPGAWVEAVTPAHCRALGDLLGRLHRAGADFPAPLPNPCGAAWRAETGDALAPLLEPDARGRLRDELEFQAVCDYSRLPRGIVHADLFRDNVLWEEGERLSGVLDFYFAGTDCLLYDLAVTANDWCADEDCLQALVDGYARHREPTSGEAAAWPALRRAAALRFWLLRLEAALRPRAGQVVTVKDPGHFDRMLQHLRLAPAGLPR